MAYQSVNPFDNKLAQSFADITDQQLETKLAAAAACFATWRHTSYAARAIIMAAQRSCCTSRPTISPGS